MKKKMVAIVAVLLLIAANVFADDVSIDSSGNVTTGISSGGNLEVTGESGEDGIVGLSSGTGAAGVYGIRKDTGNYGVLGYDNYGVFGYSESGYAGYFDGHARITGDLTVDGNLYATFSETDPKVGEQVNGFVPLWKEDALIAGSIYDDGMGSIGIGTTAPAGNLDVNGDICLGGVCRTDWPTAAFTIAEDGKTAYYMGGPVGIGTTSPGDGLTVAGGIESTIGGFWFPDGTQQTTAATTEDSDWTVDGDVIYRPTGQVLIGTTSGDAQLTVHGAIQSKAGGFIFPDGTQQMTASGWTINGSDIYRSTGNVGIGTTSPSEKLTVAGTIKSSSGGFTFPDGTSQVTAATAEDSDWTLSGDDIYRSTGNVGIGTSTPSSPITIILDEDADNTGIRMERDSDFGVKTWETGITHLDQYGFSYNDTLVGLVTGTGDWYQVSDQRLKKNIEPANDTLEGVLRLKPVRYHFKNNPDDSSPKTIGFLAQDVEKIFPGAVTEEEGIKALNYTQIIVLAVGAIQEQQQQIANLQAEVDALKALVNAGQ